MCLTCQWRALGQFKILPRAGDDDDLLFLKAVVAIYVKEVFLKGYSCLLFMKKKECI